MKMMNYNNDKKEQYIYCEKIESLTLYNDRILFKKHTHRINHIDYQDNLLMTSGDDDLIIILDLKVLKYKLNYYDINNGTQFSKFLEPNSSKIIYYGYKTFRLYIYNYTTNQVSQIVKLLIEPLNHLELNLKSNLLISTQKKDSILWELVKTNLVPRFNIKNTYYSIINSSKQEIISCSRAIKSSELNHVYTAIRLYKYNTENRNFKVEQERDIEIDFDYDIKLMNTYKNSEPNYLIVMSDYILEIINLDSDTKFLKIELKKEYELKFSYFEPAFTMEIIFGYNNGDVEIFNPLENNIQNKIKEFISKKYKTEEKISKIVNEINNNDIKHYGNVVQIKISDYYPFYVSISDEMIIYQLKNI